MNNGKIESNQGINVLIKSSISLSLGVIREFYRGLTENIGRLICINFLWFVFAIPIISLLLIKSRIGPHLFLILFFPCLLVLASPTASVFDITFKILEKKEVRIAKEFFEGMKKYRKKSIFLSIVTIALFTVGFLVMWFYAHHRSNAIAVIVVGIGFFIVLLTGFLQNYLFPLMVQRNIGIKNNILYAVYFTFDSLGFSIAVFLFSLLLSAILCLSVAGIPLLFMSSFSFLYNLSFKILLEKKYGMGDKIFEEKKKWNEFLFPIKYHIK
jgi:hypothetical protein